MKKGIENKEKSLKNCKKKSKQKRILSQKMYFSEHKVPKQITENRYH